MGFRGSETTFELTTIERLEAAGYTYRRPDELDRLPSEAVVKSELRSFLARRYPELSVSALDLAVGNFIAPVGIDTIRRNKSFHEAITRGTEIAIEGADGKEYRHIYPVDWDNWKNNSLVITNQFTLIGSNERRPDLVILINGLPLVVFELKNPYSAEPSIDDALNQLEHYKNEIPQLFDYNALCVVSDGVRTQHGMWTSDAEWYAPWRSIDGVQIEPETIGSMKVLVEGLLVPHRLLTYLRDFILFEVVKERITKKGAKYHQFFAVLAAYMSIEAASNNSQDRRAGVVWHTTGSGKTLSMVYLVGILRRSKSLANPTIVIQVDRSDLDNQLFDQFNAARSLVGGIQHATSVDSLRALLQTAGGEVVFTTVEKFRLQRDGDIETSHPILSERSNVIVIADEAHRSQYGFGRGFARSLSDALPNSVRLGFTGTPVAKTDANTVRVFGDVIHRYDMRQSQEDGATVPLYYAARQVKLHLGTADIDAALLELLPDEIPEVDIKRRQDRWTKLARVAGSKRRTEDLARDLVTHFNDRASTLAGKAMVVCMTRENCVSLYEAIRALPDAPEAAIVMTGNLGIDPPSWSALGYLTTKAKREAIKARMIDVNDSLKIVVVCDMWLTGTDIPCLHTLYIDKPMRSHNMIQAISRVNRVFEDKPHGLIVDYIGVGDELRSATAEYSSAGGKGDVAVDVSVAVPLFMGILATIYAEVPEAVGCDQWPAMSNVAMEDLYARVYGSLAISEERCQSFLDLELRLSRAFLIIKHLDEARAYADEVVFFQRVRNQIVKTLPGQKIDAKTERAVRDLVNDSIESTAVVDIFRVAGFERPDISILDNEFLQTYKDKAFTDLQLRLLQRLMLDEISRRRAKNIAKAKSFQTQIQAALDRYHARLIDSAAIVRMLVKIRQDMLRDDQRAESLGFNSEELAFYDAVSSLQDEIYSEAMICSLIHDVVQTVRRNVKVDWTRPHRQDVKANVRAAVRRILRKNGVKAEDFEKFIPPLMDQAEALYGDWPIAA